MFFQILERSCLILERKCSQKNILFLATYTHSPNSSLQATYRLWPSSFCTCMYVPMYVCIHLSADVSLHACFDVKVYMYIPVNISRNKRYTYIPVSTRVVCMYACVYRYTQCDISTMLFLYLHVCLYL